MTTQSNIATSNDSTPHTYDIAAPSLTAISFAYPVINLSNSQEIIALTARLTDDISGVDSTIHSRGYLPHVFLKSPSGKTVDIFLDSSNLISGNKNDGVYKTSISLGQYAENGTWKVDNVFLSDVAGNTVWLNPQNNSAVASAVFKTVGATTTDVIVPNLASLSLDSSGLNMAAGQGTITLTARLTDDISGVDSTIHSGGYLPHVFLKSPSGKTVDIFLDSSNLISGNKNDGVYKTSISLGQYAENGTWKVDNVFLSDVAGNTVWLNPQNNSAVAAAKFYVSGSTGSNQNLPTIGSDVKMPVVDGPVLQSYQGYNYENLNISRLSTGYIESQFLNNQNVTLPNGSVVNSDLQIHWTDGVNVYSSSFASNNIQIDQNNRIVGGTVNAYLESIWNGSGWVKEWAALDINAPASDIYNAAQTLNTTDDYIVFNRSFSGYNSQYGSAYTDIFYGVGTHNTIYAGGGNDTIISKNGMTIAGYVGPANQYQISQVGASTYVSDSNQSRDGVDKLVGVAEIKFSDFTLVLDHNAAVDTTVYQLYQAAFARMPDNAGFRYWADAVEKQGLSALQLADNFTHSQEFLQKFGQNPTNTDYVTKLYTNVLGRAPDQGGLDYWTHLADAGRSHEQLLVDFATSPENVQITGNHTANHVYWTT